MLKPILGARSVLLLDGPEHLRQRRLMLPPFHGERMRAYGEAMREVAERHVARWPVGQPFAVHPTMQAITLEVILRTVFGVEDRAGVERLGAPLQRLLDLDRPAAAAARCCSSTSSESATPRSPWGRFRALTAPADAMIYEEIAAPRAPTTGRARRHPLAAARRARRGRQRAHRRELRDELMTLLLAGHETTATALAWTLERLVRHPDVLERLRDEQAAGGDGVPRRRRQGDAAPAARRARRGPPLQRPMTIGGMELPAGVQHRAVDLPAPPPRPTSTPTRRRSGPSASSATTRRAPTSGSRSAAASAAASARASRSTR